MNLEIVKKLTANLYRCVTGFSRDIILSNTVHECFEVSGIDLPTKAVDPVSGRSLVSTGGMLFFEDTGTPYEGTPEYVVDEDAIMPGADPQLTVREFFEMGDFIASITFYCLGNCYVAPDGSRVEELTAFGRPPLSHAEMHRIRRKYSL